jgi:MORN repeat variant
MKGLIIIVILLISCNANIKSKIVVRKLNTDSIQRVLRSYVLSNVDTPARSDFYYVYHFTNNTDGTLINILKDSLYNIEGINKSKNGIVIFISEYFPNGQIKGDIPLGSNGEPEGLATYYYEDGRIRSIGRWKGYKEVGEWRRYDKAGNPKKNK